MPTKDEIVYLLWCYMIGSYTGLILGLIVGR